MNGLRIKVVRQALLFRPMSLDSSMTGHTFQVFILIHFPKIVGRECHKITGWCAKQMSYSQDGTAKKL